MKDTNIPRRDFIRKVASSAAFLTAVSSIQSVYGDKLAELAGEETGDSQFNTMRKDYLLAPEITYFNHGSIGTIPKIVHEAHIEYLRLCESNPWYYMWSDPWKAVLAGTREKAAAFLGADAAEIAFTHNTTEGFNVLAIGLPLAEEDEVLFSTLNHSGASKCWFHHGESRGYRVRQFEFPIQEVPNLNRQDIIDLYSGQITGKTKVLVIPHVDNLVGVRYPVKAIAAMAREKGVQYIAVDGAQAVGMIPVNIADLGVDFYAMSPHKWLQSPKGTGMLYIRKAIQEELKPMWVTWGQQTWKGTVRIFEDYGTRNLAEVLALGNAIEFQQQLGIEKTAKRRMQLRKYFQEAVEQSSSVSWHSSKPEDLGASLFSIKTKNRDSKTVFQSMFPEHGFVFRAFTLENWNTMRISPNVFNTIEEIDRFLKLLEA